MVNTALRDLDLHFKVIHVYTFVIQKLHRQRTSPAVALVCCVKAYLTHLSFKTLAAIYVYAVREHSTVGRK